MDLIKGAISLRDMINGPISCHDLTNGPITYITNRDYDLARGTQSLALANEHETWALTATTKRSRIQRSRWGRFKRA